MRRRPSARLTILATAIAATAIALAIAFALLVDAGTQQRVAFAQADENGANSPATGMPAIRGSARVGETLTADTSGVQDSDGVNDVEFGYQWTRSDGTTDADISGATGMSYVLTSSDVRRTIKVRVFFTDNGNFSETLTSGPTATVLDLDVCRRSPQVRDAIVQAVANAESCAEVSPADLAGLNHTLNLDSRGISTLKAWDFDGLTKLRRLTLVDNRLRELPDGVFDNFTRLRELDLRSNRLREWPDGAFDNLTELRGLYLTENDLRDVPDDAFDNLTGLYWLLLEYNDLRELPDGIFDNLTALRTLYLNSNDLRELPDGIFDNLTRLEILSIGGNDLGELPEGLFDTLTRLRELSVSFASLTELPDGIFDNLASLRWLAVSSNKLRELPEGIFVNLTKLNVLYIMQNWLGELPDGIFQGLTELQSLYMHHNSGNPFTFTAELERRGGNTVRVNADPATPFDMEVRLSAEGGTLSSTRVSIAAGSVSSHPVTVNRDGNRSVTIKVVSVAFRRYTALSGIGARRGDPLRLEANNPATGAPAIVGPAQVGKTLTADTSTIADADGMSGAQFAHQWLRSRDTEIAGATDTTYEPQASDEGKTLKVRVTFADDVGHQETLFSAGTYAVAAAGPPQAPTNLKALSRGDGSITLTWNGPDNGTVTGYRIDRRSSGGGDSAVLVEDTGSAGADYTDQNVAEGAQYEYRVSARNDDGTGEASDWVKSRPPEDRPHGLSAVAKEGVIELTWNEPDEGVPGYNYRILRHRPEEGEPEPLVYVDDTDSRATEYTDTGVSADIRYVYRVQAMDVFGYLGKPSRAVSVLGPGSSSPATGRPTIGGTAQVGETLTAEVSGIADADGLSNVTFQYRWLSSRDTEIPGATNSTYVLQASDADKTVKVRVSFTDDAGNEESLTSAPTAAVSAAPPPPPDNVRAVTQKSGAVELNWDAPDDATVTGYRIERRRSGGGRSAEQTLVEDTGSSETGYTDQSAEKGVEYEYRVSARNENGAGEASGWVSAAPDEEPVTSEDVAVWSATMTVEWVYQGYGYYSTHAKKAGSLSPASFEVDGTTYTVQMVETQGWWMYIGVDRELPFDFVLELDGARFASDDASFRSYSYGNIYRWEGTGLSWRDGDTVEVRLLGAFEDETAVNSAAMGAPVISGTAQVGETLTADTSGIEDADGLTNVTFSYQWLAGDTAIQGATNADYTLAAADEGKVVKVQVSFTDDVGNGETLTSAATATVDKPTGGICDRTEQVRDDIISMLNAQALGSLGIKDCSEVTDEYLTRIWVLDLNGGGVGQKITSLKSGDFQGLSGLTELELVDNSLSELPEGVFDGLASLEILTMHENDLGSLPDGVFDDLANLDALALHDNELAALPDGVFDQLTELSRLFIADNKLTALRSDEFEGVPNLADLIASNNELTTLPAGLFEGLSKLEVVSFTGNTGAPFTLTGELERQGDDGVVVKVAEGAPFEMTVTLSVEGGTLSVASANVPAGGVQSAVVTVIPGESGGEVVVSMVSAAFQGGSADGVGVGVGDSVSLNFPVPTPTPTLVPSIGICDRTQQVQDGILARLDNVSDCALVTESDLNGITGGLGLQSKSISALRSGDFDGLGNLRTLQLDENRISALPEDVFDGLDNLTYLYLAGNRITVLPEDVFDGLDSLRNLEMSNNRISALPEDVFDGLNGLTSLSLDDNQISEFPAGVFDGLGSLVLLWLSGNPGAPFTFTAVLEQRGDNAIVVKVAQGAPVAMSVSLSAAGGNLSDDTVTVAAGSLESDAITVTATGGGEVTVSVESAEFVESSSRNIRGIRTGVGGSLALGSNIPATGGPTINGTAQVGETLTADTSGIADEDGLDAVTFSYQWLADETAIQGATDSGYTLVEADEGKGIKVRVSFTDDAGNAETLTSGATDAVAAPEPPARPTGLSSTVSHDTVTLTWDDPNDDSITGYVILRRDKEIHEEGTFVTVAPDTESADTTYTDDTVEPSKQYVYRIKAINSHGLSEISSWVRGYTPAAPDPAPEPPAKPTGLSATVSHDTVTLTWDDPGDDSITGYVILRRNRDTDAEGEFTTLVEDTGSADTSYTDESVVAETPYTYRIKAINEHGVSERSRWVHVETTAAPTPEGNPDEETPDEGTPEQSVSEGDTDLPNDNSTPGRVAVGGWATGAIGTPGDQDRFAVDLAAGRTYRFDLTGSPGGGGTLPDTFFRAIYNSAGDYQADSYNDDFEGGRDSRVAFTPTESGTYYARVSGDRDEVGSYTLSVTDVTPQ